MGHEEVIRFKRLPKGSAGGVKLAGRRDVNPRVSPQEAIDETAFFALLRARLGQPDRRADGPFSYCVRDELLGIEFEAYSGSSGPAYGGSPPDHFIDFERNDNRVKAEVLDALAAFERWLLGGDNQG